MNKAQEKFGQSPLLQEGISEVIYFQKENRTTEPLEIGERFLLCFEDPEIAPTPQLGRLQDRRADGALYIDVPDELRPPRGTQVKISSLRRHGGGYHFSSEILGRSRLNGRLPVLLVKAPQTIEWQQRRAAYRISVAIKARIEWEDPQSHQFHLLPAVVIDLSGSGAQVFARQVPQVEFLRLTLSVPDSFVKEWSTRQKSHADSTYADPRLRIEAQLRAYFESIPARIVRVSQRGKDPRPLYALSVAFLQPHEGCYRLVRYLERQAAQKGIVDRKPADIVSAA